MKNIWKLDFRKLWGIDGDGETWNDPDCSSEQVEIFIESLLADQKKELLEEIKKDLLDITKGIDDDGSEYIACQIDYFDIEDLFKRYD